MSKVRLTEGPKGIRGPGALFHRVIGMCLWSNSWLLFGQPSENAKGTLGKTKTSVHFEF
ncbi:uncharacterized protein PGTG_02536 [Puccinia graminis f. sp. tritici CRL 75-36-700-3]|uniref:Uncharacterized protein n=1 Tax=Puccinia graminis f. sp. tritici (strain CRL 75-36-700-3 / race SCCL) TaxID=418459 RepID=E3JVM0_PUCGT|nr:uncharacterized protein PGTG_02536 [Puccinia graminis f. sp. tritici CRL 75-36-700-3]EFP76095.1 hypothetical protein PGTG_02536 [Puccinia graminis f. sp. tritici CRL 75-36-700-3]